MERKYTPGKWEARPENNSTGSFSIETNEEWPTYVAQTISVEPDTEWANAHLIAAAPDLLEALELILPNIEALATERFGSKLLETYKPVLQAREAIDKALGKEVSHG